MKIIARPHNFFTKIILMIRLRKRIPQLCGLSTYKEDRGIWKSEEVSGKLMKKAEEIQFHRGEEVVF